MKILEINKFYYLKRGAERHFLDVISLLEKAGNQVAVFSMQSKQNLSTPWSKYFLSEVGYTAQYSWKEKIKGIGRMFFSLEAKRKINALLDEFQPDIVHIHNIYHQLSPIILFEIKKRGIPIVMTVHDFKLISPNHSLYLNGEFYDRCSGGRYYRCFFDKCVKNSYTKSFLAMLEMYWHKALGTYAKNIDQYIVPSEFVKEILLKNGIAANKLIVVPHFISENNEIISAKTNVEKEKPYALYVGAISKNKGVDELLQIFSNNVGLELHLAGAMEDEIDFSKFQNIKYLGFLSKEELTNVMQNAVCVVSGSRLPETFGLIALEALSYGKPFFGFHAGAYGEIISNGENGFLVKGAEEFKQKMIDFSKQIFVVDSEKIRKKAYEKYAPNAYLSKIMEIFLQARKS